MDKKENELSKKVRGENSDKIVIASIVIFCVVFAFAIFGVYFYNTNLKAIAKFDGGNLTISEYTVYYKMYAQYLAYSGYSEEEIPEEIAQQAALEKVLVLEAKNAGMTLSDEDKKEVDEMFEDETRVSQYKEMGFDIAALKNIFYNNAIITAYMEKLENEATEEEVVNYIKSVYGEDANLTEYVTRHILFLTVDATTGVDLSDDKKEEARQKAEAVLARVLNGENFEELAKEYSDDSTAENGGLYNMYLDDNTDDSYESAVLNLQVGGITTSLVESKYGYHIIKLDAINENGRANSENERANYINKKISTITTEKNLSIDEKALQKAVEAITGKTATAANDTTNTDVEE